MIPKQELQDNAVQFIKQLNDSAPLSLGAIVIFFDKAHGYPVIAGNTPPEQMRMVLNAVLRGFDSAVVDDGGTLQ